VYPHAQELCILADSGGSNGCRSRAWKFNLQYKLTNVFEIVIRVVYYPSRASKWNLIEHRLFSKVSKNWAGIPLLSMDAVLYLSVHHDDKERTHGHRREGNQNQLNVNECPQAGTWREAASVELHHQTQTTVKDTNKSGKLKISDD